METDFDVHFPPEIAVDSTITFSSTECEGGELSYACDITSPSNREQVIEKGWGLVHKKRLLCNKTDCM